MLYYGICCDRSLAILIAEELGNYKVEKITLDHVNEKSILKYLFGVEPIVKDIVNIIPQLQNIQLPLELLTGGNVP